MYAATRFLGSYLVRGISSGTDKAQEETGKGVVIQHECDLVNYCKEGKRVIDQRKFSAIPWCKKPQLMNIIIMLL